MIMTHLGHRYMSGWLAACAMVAFLAGGAVPVMGDAVAIIQTYNGSGAVDFMDEAQAPLAADSLIMMFFTTNQTAALGFNTATPTAPRAGDVLLGSYPMTEAGMPEFAGQVSGHLAKRYGIGQAGKLYMAVYDLAYQDFLNAGQLVPAQTPYALLTNVLVTAQYDGLATLLTDYGGAVNDAVAVNGAYRTSERIIPFLPAPTNVAASARQLGSILITWSPVAGANSYNLWRGLTTNIAAAAALASTTNTWYSDTNIVAGLSYYYWIRAVGGSDTSGYSTVSNAGRSLRPSLSWLQLLLE